MQESGSRSESHPRDGLIHEFFELRAALHPQAPALVHGEVTLNYLQLNEYANRIAQHLLSLGVAPDDRVVLCAERGIGIVAGLLGILKAGAAYVPMDPDYPRERLRFMLADCRPVAVLTGESLLPVLADCLGQLRSPVLRLEDFATDGIACDNPDSRRIGLSPSNLAYVIYTSGSTGMPKGVMVEHHSVINLWRALETAIFGALPERGRIGLNAPLSFDASVKSLTQLLSGRCVVIVPKAIRADSTALLAFISGSQLAAVDCTPLQLELLLDAGLLSADRWRPHAVLIGGEAIAPATWRRLQTCTAIRFFNVYGPTECTVDATIAAIDVVATQPHIGRAIANASVHILDARLRPVAEGEAGQLCIGGAGVARGYLDRPELTAERFIVDPFNDQPGARLYLTGDRARMRADGNIEFLGREDFQLKLRGFRVEPGEIEAGLRECQGVRDAVVVAREDKPGDIRLVAYYVADPQRPPATVELRQQLSLVLPPFMLPDLYVALDRIPLTSNGKLDRSALPAPDRHRPELAVAFEPGANEVEVRLCALFAEILGIDRCGRHDSFFELGGNSLLALRLLGSLQSSGHAGMAATAIFAAPTPARLALALSSGASGLDQNRLATSHRDWAQTADFPTSGQAGSATRSGEPVAIIAMAGRYPGAKDVERFWENIRAGIDSITFFKPDELDQAIPLSDRIDPAYVPARGVIDGVEEFDAGFFGIAPREAELMDPQHRIFLELCWECMERAAEIPDASRAPVGVFAGTWHSTYFRRHVQAHPDKVEKVGEFQVMLGNEKDYIATRVANKLNLTGPAISMVTGCSTSLVAISQALDSLQGGRCDMALAGGVAVTCPPRSGYKYLEGSMLSPDGHIRPFDVDAQGTVFSDGAGVVLLKRLSDAIRDGNPVHALLLGGAVNNDGGGKASFTAPSSDGQAAVIAMALDNAGADARSISYIETHGTATPLGDPIEIEGLNKAFRRSTADTGFCQIGSVKSNIGHSVIAAGVAGVIKTALSLSHRQIPPMANFSAPNPRLALEGSPFQVNAQMRDWRGDGPLRAGVSSFGVGGTNAHVVMQQAPVLPGSDTSDGPSLVVLSARTPAALAQAASDLSASLQGGRGGTSPDETAEGAGIIVPAHIGLADISWTLAVGRKAFAHRAAVVAATREELISQLRSPELAASIKRSKPARSREPVFMFPGQGSHYPGMGRALHETEPAFAAAFDEVVEALRDGLSLDLRPLVFGDDPAALLPTAIMQPAIFCVEYALARWWLSQGVVPSALIGHSIGEFAAAAIAGIFTPGDAACLLARRGALMQAQPGGAMLSVRLPVAEVLARLPANLALAAENSRSSCVVAGSHAAVDAFRQGLENKGVACRELRTSHAFHSAMMEPAVEPFRQMVAAVPRSAPSLRMVSASTGQWLDDATVMSADYWAEHLRKPVLFADALGRVLESPDQLLIEVGPRATLCQLARQHPSMASARSIAVASLGDSPTGEPIYLREAVGQLWCHGGAPDPACFDRRERRQRVLLPTYPFERQAYWVSAAWASRGRDRIDESTSSAQAQSADIPDPSVAAEIVAARDAAVPAPHGQLIAQLCGLFEDVSGFELGLDDHQRNFMELGMDSLMLTQVALQLQKRFKLRISFRELMGECASLERLAGRFGDRMPAPAEPAEAGTPAPAGSTAPPIDEVKLAFGAIGRIDTVGRPGLDDRQRRKLDEYTRRYLARTARSKQYTQENRPHLADPRVAHGFSPLMKEFTYQIVIERSKGAHMWDIDGNHYVDALGGFGVNLFGWQPDFVLDAIRRQLDRGYEIGPQNPLAGDVARMLCEMTGHERAGLCNTGSEAVLCTLRIARTVTGRDTVVVFTGSHHGIIDEMIVRAGRDGQAVPAAPGIPGDASANVLVLEYGSPLSLDIIRSRAGEIAAVLVEPVQSRHPHVQPREFLHQLRALTRSAGIVLVFDEVITGFRSHPQGVQGLFGLKADLATYGKAVGGGLPIAMIAGCSDLMDALDGGQWRFGDDSAPTVGVTCFAGTFVQHPLALAAARAVLEHLRKEGPSLQERLNSRTALLASELDQFCVGAGAPVQIRQFSSMWRIHFSEDHPLQELLFGMMRSRGVHILDNFCCFMSTAHQECDYQHIARAFKDSVLEMQECGFFPTHQPAERLPSVATGRPSAAGARLGRAPDGSPAWFIPDPKQPGKYLRIDS